MTNCLNITKLSRRSMLGGLAVVSAAAAAGAAISGPDDQLEYHLAEAARLLRLRDPAFPEWDIVHFNGPNGTMQAVHLVAFRSRD